MQNSDKEATNRIPKIFSNICVALIFWFAHYFIIGLENGSTQFLFLEISFLVVSILFFVRALLNSLIILEKINEYFLLKLGINEKQSKQRISKMLIYIILVLLFNATLFPIINQYSPDSFVRIILTSASLCLIFLFIFDIGRTLSRYTTKKANFFASKISKFIINDEN